MADIFREVDEDVRKARYLKLWKAYGVYAIAIAVVIAVAVAGGVGWDQYRQSQREADGLRFGEALLLTQEGRHVEAAAAFAELGGSASSGYATLSHFQEASALARAGDSEAAVSVYDGIAADGGPDAALRDLARLLAVMQLVDTAAADELDRRLEPLVREDGVWRYSARELAGLVAHKRGELAEARELFAALAADPGAPTGIRTRAAEMFAALGGDE